VAGHAPSGGGRELTVQHRRRMPRAQRAAVYLIVGVLWISGCAWLCLDQFAAQRVPFGNAPHPLEPPLLLIHGVVSVASLYLFGWIGARHALRWWAGDLRRWSGGVLAAVLALLILSGFALFFLSSDAWQRYAAAAHDVLGVALTLFAVQHWFFGKRSTRAVVQKVSR
jgi:hypothetical protein